MDILKDKKLTLVSILLFVILFAVGVWLSTHKAVWNDEIYTQTNTIEKFSVWQILTVKFEEGNSSPLFYLIQKANNAVFNYHFPQKWQGEWEIKDLRSQIIMRLPCNLFMSLALTAMFWFFAKEFSFLTGVYALITGLSSFMVAAYWLEARPYALWFLLTTLLCLLFLKICYRKKIEDQDLRMLTFLYCVLSFTVIFGALQIFCLSLLLVFIDRSRIKTLIAVSAVPLLICVGYYILSPKFKFWFMQGPQQLISASIPKDRLLILAIYAVVCGLAWVQTKSGCFSLFSNQEALKGKMFLALTALTLGAAASVLMVFQAKADPGQAGFMISNRYFIFLAPVGAIAFTMAVMEILRALKGRPWLQGAFVSAAGGLTIFRIYRTFMLAREVYYF